MKTNITETKRIGKYKLSETRKGDIVVENVRNGAKVTINNPTVGLKKAVTEQDVEMGLEEYQFRLKVVRDYILSYVLLDNKI